MEEGRSAFKILTDTLAGKRALGRPRRRWEDNIKIDIKEMDTNTRKWVHSVHDKDYFGIEPPGFISHGIS
jgi:hypothetical protein